MHFSQPSVADPGGIKIQDDHKPSVPTSQWKVGQTIDDAPREIKLADNIADGDYEISTGFYNESGRATLSGDTDATGRTKLGVLQVRDGGKSISFVPQPDTSGARNALYLQDVNAGNRVVDFGSVRTSGSAMIRRDGADWVLQTLPRDKSFALQLSAARFGMPAKVRADGGKTAPVTPSKSANGFWTLPQNGARISLESGGGESETVIALNSSAPPISIGGALPFARRLCEYSRRHRINFLLCDLDTPRNMRCKP